MPLWGVRQSEADDKPKHLVDDVNAKKEVQKDECVGVKKTDVGGKVGSEPGTNRGSGWTMPAGGNGNPNADREVIVTANIK